MSESSKISVIIADDEPIARQVLAHFLTDEPDFELLGEYGDGQAALEAIIKDQPDLVLLDIEMPELSGIDLVTQLEQPLPMVIFVTAFDQYAVKAFEENALDYLLKPFDHERFRQSLDRARQQLSKDGRSHMNESEALLEVFSLLLNKPGQSRYLKKINCKHKGKISFIPVEEVLWIESEGGFCKLHLAKGMQLTNLSIKRLEELLDPATHLRIHKSHMINIDRIESIEPYFHGEYMVNLQGGQSLKLSRGYKDRLEGILNQYK